MPGLPNRSRAFRGSGRRSRAVARARLCRSIGGRGWHHAEAQQRGRSPAATSKRAQTCARIACRAARPRSARISSAPGAAASASLWMSALRASPSPPWVKKAREIVAECGATRPFRRRRQPGGDQAPPCARSVLEPPWFSHGLGDLSQAQAHEVEAPGPSQARLKDGLAALSPAHRYLKRGGKPHRSAPSTPPCDTGATGAKRAAFA